MFKNINSIADALTIAIVKSASTIGNGATAAEKVSRVAIVKADLYHDKEVDLAEKERISWNATKAKSKK